MAFVVNIAKGFVDAGVDLVTGAVDIIVDIVDFAVDEIIQPVLQGVGDVVDYAMDNPIEAAAKLALLVFAPASVSAWAIPLVDGAATIAKGGDIEDGIKAAAISYAGSQVGAKVGANVGGSLAEAGYGSTVSAAISGGTKSATVALIYGQDPLQAFATGGINAGVGALLADIDTKLTNAVEGQLDEFNKPVISGWENLQDGVKDSITASLAAELDGGSISANTLSGIVTKYTGVVKTMNKFLTDNTGIEAGRAAVITSALTQAATTALAGNPEMSGEAFFARIDQYGMEELKKLADKPVQKFLDKVDGSYQATETAATALNDVITKTADAADGFNGLRTELNGKIQEQDRLRDVFTVAKAAYDANPTQAAADAQNDAAGAFNVYADQLKVDYETTYKPQMDAFQATYDEFNPQIEGLQGEYDTANKYMLSDIDNLSAEMKPVFSDTERAVALALRPGIDEDAYRKATGIGEDVDVYRHYLENQKSVNNIIVTEQAAELQNYIAEGDFSSGFNPSNAFVDSRINKTAPAGLTTPDMDDLPTVDLTVPRTLEYSGRGGDPREYGLTPEEVAEYKNSNGAWGPAFLQDMGLSKEEAENYNPTAAGLDLWYNFSSGGLEAAAFTFGGGGTLADEISENIQNAFKGIDQDEANRIAFSNWGIIHDPNLTAAEKKAKIEENVVLEVAAREKAIIQQGVGDVTFFTGYTDPIKNFLMGTEKDPGLSITQARKISPEMQVRQMNALPAPDTTWEQILSGQAKDRLGRPYGLGDPVATLMSGVQELPDLLVDVALLALTRNPAVLARGAAAVTGLGALEGGEAAADEIKAGLNDAYKSGKLQQEPEWADLVRVYEGDEEAALAKLIDQGMSYAAVSGAIAGVGDLLLAKIATASGGSALLSVVPKYLQPIVKVGTGGLSEGLNEASEQVPINMAFIEAGLGNEISISTGTGAAFLTAVTSGGSTTASALAVQNTVNALKNGTYSYTSGDGTTVTPDPPAEDSTDYNKLTETSNNLTRHEAYTNFVNEAVGQGVLPETNTGAEFVEALRGLGIDNVNALNEMANLSYDAEVVTNNEVIQAAQNAQPELIFTGDIADNAFQQFTGVKSDADLATVVASYIDPFYFDRTEVIDAAAVEGVTLTDEQADEYVGTKDEVAAVEEVKVAVDSQATTREEAEQFFADQNYTPTEEEILARVGEVSEADQKTAIDEYVKPRMTSEAEVRQAFADQGYEPSDEEVADRVGQGGEDFATNTLGGVESYAKPRMTNEADVRDELARLGYSDPTDAEIAAFVGQGDQNFATTKFADIEKFADPLVLDAEEAKAAALTEGVTLTDEQAAALTGKKNEVEAIAKIKTDVDPQATTREEAEQFFADQNYTPTEEEILARVGQVSEADQKTAIDTYVKPRITSEEEVRQAFEDQGYVPTDEEVAALVGQGDDTFADTTLGGVEGYADERITTAAEVRAEFEKAGLVDVSQEDVDKFVGQLNENDQLAAVKEYVPTATTNIVKALIGSPSIADDPNTEEDESKEATGVYKSIEEGKTGNEALEAALGTLDGDVDAIAKDLIDLTGDVGAVGGDVDALQAAIGEEGVTDDPDTEEDETKDPTGIFATIKAYEDSGVKRDDALQLAVDDVSAALGTTKTELIAEIDKTQGDLSKEIGAVKTDLGEDIGAVRTDLGADIGAVRTDLGADIDVVADFVGKPAREVTQDDVDFVIDLIAQEGVNAELTMQYDVTGDGIVDIADQTLLEDTLQGGDTTLADTSMFDPATGLYLKQDTDTQATLDAITDMNTEINTNINTQTQRQNVNELAQLLGGASDAGGQRVDVTPGEKLNLNYLYDISGDSIFANQQQEGLFASPYGNRRSQPQAANTPFGPLSRASGFAQGGQVEDENDRLLRLLGDL